MQKALRINLVKRNQTIRKNRKNLFKTRRSQERDYDEWAVANSRLTNSQIKEERKNRREDWILGPLAPDRDTGLKKGALGTIDVMQAQARAPPKHLVGGPIPGRNWEGEGNIGNIVVGDRVVAVKGPSRGQIGTVKELDKAKAQVVVGDVNTADVEFPPYMDPKQSSQRKFSPQEIPLRLEDIRLVHRMLMEDSSQQDVVIKHIRGGAPHYEREIGSNIPRHTRYIAGTEDELPWPEAEILEKEKEPMDTSRKDVEEETYMPSMHDPPLPPGAEDELINKYKRGRMSHEHSYIARKIVEDARSAWYEQRRLLTPRQEAAERRTTAARQPVVQEEEVWNVVKQEMGA